MAIVARNVRVTGAVQGVSFRAWTRDQARKHGVTGWIRNCPDGSVEAHLEGDDGAINWLIDLIGEGPAGSRVEHVRRQEAEVEGLSGFEVRH